MHFYWYHLKHFWFALAVWAATKCFNIVDIHAVEDVVTGLVWSNDKDFANYVADYQGEKAIIERHIGTNPPVEARRTDLKE